MIIHDWKKDFFTIPNYLSLFRLLLIPVYVLIYLKATTAVHHAIAAGILALSCLTDLMDGWIARRYHMISVVGKFLDPLADKATQFTLTLCLAIRYPVLWNLAALFVLKEAFQLTAGVIMLRRGKMLTGALLTGKICTAVLFLSFICMVLVPNIQPWVVEWIGIADSLCLLIAFGHYALTYLRNTAMIQDIDRGYSENS